ncbi:MAG: gliding motility-associated C-terminal domain-containing protein [Crocinitomicaceae bacterium]|nr:gliding motility-associated C-terminal domain-containing protein [Crocinitomicaceae bacterium]
MKFKVCSTYFSLLLSFAALTQTFSNGELDGPVGTNSVPTGWQNVPDTDPASQASGAINATVDIFDTMGPNVPGGMNGNPYSCATFCSGLHLDGGTFFNHEGIMQTVNGFTIGNSYTITFYQTVVKQQNAIDTSGSWRVYFDNTLIGTSAVSTSNLPFNSNNLVWEIRSVTFTATATSHIIKFLPWDDDANQFFDTADPAGALRMGIDLISFGNTFDPSIDPAGPFCSNAMADTLTAASPGGIWSGNGIINPSTGAFDPIVAGVGNHTIVYELNNTCGGTIADSIIITVTSTANASWTNPGVICEADGPIDLSILITGDPGGVWSGTGVTGSTFDPTGLSGPVSVTYSVGSPPCNDSNTQDITVTSNPSASWTPPTGLCTASPLFDLNTAISGTTGGTWSGTGITGSNFDPSVGTQSITYTVGSGSCQQTSTQTITIGSGGNPSWTTLSMCASDAPINLTGQITGDTGGTWSGTGVTGSIFDPFFGTQDITYTVGSPGCEQSSTQTITVIDLQLSTSSTDISCYGLSDGTAVVTVAGATGGQTYSWSPTGQTSATASGLSAGTYTVTVTDGSCVATGTVSVYEPSEITTTLTANHGCSPNPGSASVMVSGGTGSFTYFWMPSGQTTEIVNNLDSAMHSVTVTDANGCTQTDSILVQILVPPNVMTIQDTTILYPNCITLTAIGADTYTWTPDTDLTCDNCQITEACPMYQTVYCVEGTDTNGCKNTDCVIIDVEIICGDVFVPSAFSPNNDGENDVLCVYSDCMKSMVFTVYNRWGEKVFEVNSPNICWDGTWNGKALNAAVFVYVLEGSLLNGEQVIQKGNISLIR